MADDGLVYIFINGKNIGDGIELSATDVIPVTGITIDPTSIVINDKNILYTINSKIIPDDATNKKIIWSSSDSNIATVSSTGVITAISNGSVLITAMTSSGGFIASCTVKVAMPISVTGIEFLDNDDVKINIGSTTLAKSYIISPSNADNLSVTWKSSNESVATIDNNGDINCISAGETIITVTTVDGGYEASYKLIVREVGAYATNGLLADYDALNNTGTGEFDSKAITWVDISGNGRDLDLTMRNGIAGSAGLLANESGDGMAWNSTDHYFYWKNASSGVQGPYINTDQSSIDGISIVVAVADAKLIGYGAIVRCKRNATNYDGTSFSYNEGPCVPFHYTSGSDLKIYTICQSLQINCDVNNSIFVFTEDSDGNYVLYRNGSVIASGAEAISDLNLNYVQFFHNCDGVKVHRMSVYNRALTEEEVVDISSYLENRYSVSGISEVSSNIVQSGTILPYTEYYATASVAPANKINSTTITMESDNTDVLEVI